MVVLGIVIVLGIVGIGSVGSARIGKEYVLVLMMIVLGIVVMLRSKDFCTLIIGIEIEGLGYYALVGMSRNVFGLEGSLKYWMIGSLSSGMLMLGIVMFYLGTGSLEMEVVGTIGVDRIVRIGYWLCLVGIGTKLGIGVMYVWFIDVIEGCNGMTGRIVGIVGKVSMLYCLCKLGSVGRMEGMEVIGMIGMLIGSLGSFYARKLKRFIGLSGMVQLGMVVVCLGSVGSSLEGILVIERNIVVYSMSMIVIWYVVGEGVIVRMISSLGRIVGSNGTLGVVLVVVCLSLAGIPVMLGFVVKMEMLMVCVGTGMLGIAVIMVLVGIIVGYNYLKWLKVIYFEGSVGIGMVWKEEVSSVVVAMIVIGIVIGSLGIR